MKTFRLDFCGHVTLPVSSIWAAGDAPQDPSPEDVLIAMMCAGGLEECLSTWDLAKSVDVTVSEVASPIGRANTEPPGD